MHGASCGSTLKIIALGLQVADVVERFTNWDFAIWAKLDEKWDDLHRAYRIVDQFVLGWEMTSNAKRLAGHLVERLQERQEVATVA